MKGVKYCAGGLLIVIAFYLLIGGLFMLSNFAADLKLERSIEVFGLDIPQRIVVLVGFWVMFVLIGAFVILVAICVGIVALGYIIVNKAKGSEKKDVKTVRKLFFGILFLILIFGWSCNGKESSLPSISDFPEEIVSDGELARWDSATFSFINGYFLKPIWTDLHHQLKRECVAACSYRQGKNTKRPVIVFHVIPRNGPSFAVCAYYADELKERVEKKYSDDYSDEQAIAVLRPEINRVAKGLARTFNEE